MISLRVKVILCSDFAMGTQKQREVLVNKLVDKSQCNTRENPLKKKLMDRLHIPPYLFLSREDDDDVRDIGKRYFRSVLLHHMLSNANQFHLLCFLSTPYSFSISSSHSRNRNFSTLFRVTNIYRLCRNETGLTLVCKYLRSCYSKFRVSLEKRALLEKMDLPE